MVQLQNELARLEVDILHTQGRNLRVKQAMQLLNEDIDEKMQTIGKYEVSHSTQGWWHCQHTEGHMSGLTDIESVHWHAEVGK